MPGMYDGSVYYVLLKREKTGKGLLENCGLSRWFRCLLWAKEKPDKIKISNLKDIISIIDIMGNQIEGNQSIIELTSDPVFITAKDNFASLKQ
jgi:hypothetical protein